MSEHIAGKAWVGLAAGVALYDVLAPKGETLSEGMDRAMERPVPRVLAIGAVALTASHLCNFIPERYDPFHYALKWKDRT